MTTNVTTTNINATRERRTPNYVFLLRAVLSEIMDKWMANLAVRSKNNCRRPIMTPHYVHRCVRLIREIVDQHPEGEEFEEKFSNTLLVWLQKEVLPGFSGSESQKRNKNPFINVEMGKDTFLMNQKGRLDKVQYGLKAFLVSLVVHKVLDLTQVLRLVFVPLFPRLVSFLHAPLHPPAASTYVALFLNTAKKLQRSSSEPSEPAACDGFGISALFGATPECAACRSKDRHV